MSEHKSALDPPPISPTCSTSSPAGSPSQAATDNAPSSQPTKPTTLSGKLWRALKWVLDLMIAQWFLIGIGVVIALAHSYPNVARDGGVLEAQWSEKYLLIAIIFFISGLSLTPRSLYERALDWRTHALTQLNSFLVFPTIMFAIVSFIRLADPNFERFSRWAMVGMVVMGCLPTTVSSNVVMTGQAGGDQSSATIEVMLGNLVGTFLSPALLQMFFSQPKWSFGVPVASGPGGTGELYRQVIEQLGFSVFIPLFVGEVIQYLFPTQVKWVRLKLRLAKLGSLCLLGVIWSTFSTAFAAGALQSVTWETILMLVLVNLLMYGAFSLYLFALARWVKLPSPCVGKRAPGPKEPILSAEVTVALLFCGAAKGMALGGPIVQILYGGLSDLDGATVLIPLLLYQAEQIVCGQITVEVMKRWMLRVKKAELREANLEGDVEKVAGMERSVEREETLVAEDEATTSPTELPVAGEDKNQKETRYT